MTTPTNKELEVLKLFRMKVMDVENELPIHFRTDIMMLTWLRARNMNINQAEEMLRKSIEWRKLHDIYKAHEWSPPEEYLKNFYFEISGYTNEGYPVVVIQVGKWDVRKVIEKDGKELFLKYINYIFSTMINVCIERSVLADKIVSQFVLIIDAQGFPLRQVTLMAVVDTIVECAKRFEANFPESLNKCFLVNAPRIFPIVFAIIKPILSAATANKIEPYGPNAKKWKLALKNYIPEDQYPIQYGGTKTVGTDSGLNNIILNKSFSNDDDNNEEFISVTVSAGDTFEIAIDISSPGTTTLNWSFKTDDYDIGFCIKREQEDIQKLEKYDSHIQKQEGSLLCDQIGKYLLIFDNTYSRLRSKCLHYTVDMTTSLEPDDDEDEWTSL